MQLNLYMADKIHIVKTKAYPTTVEGIAKFYDEWADTYDKVRRYKFTCAVIPITYGSKPNMPK